MLEKRRLAWKDRFVIYLIQVLSDRFDDYPNMPSLPFTDLDTRVPVTFILNQTEYTQMYSALSAGAELVFPSISHELRYIFEVPVEYPMTCEDIINCIENDGDTILALQTFLASNGYGTGSGTYSTPSIHTTNPILADGGQISGCDNDNLFGAITQLVDFMHSTLTDIFERIEAGSNYLERTQLLLSGIPGIGLLPLDEFVDFADNVISALGENYAAQYTTEMRDEFRCDLFCACKDTCEMDFQLWSDYFMSRVGSPISTENLSDGLEWFVTGVWEGTQVVDAAHALLCDILAYGSQFFELDAAYLGRVVTSAMNDPDSDWTTLCEDCPDATSTPVLDYTNSCSMFGSAVGTGLTNVGGFSWQVTGQNISGTRYVTIQRADGGAFRLSNPVLVSGTAPNFWAWHVNGEGTCGSGGAYPDWSTVDFTFFSWARTADFVIGFDFEDV